MTGIDLKKLAPKPVGRVTMSGEEAGFIDKLTALLTKDFSFSGDQLADKKKEAFYMELGILVAAGVDIRTSLEIIEEEQTIEKEKVLYKTIKENVVKGSSLSEAIKLSGKFSDYEYFSIQIGEESGKLSAVLKELASYYQSKIKQKRLMIGSLSYPVLVLCTSLGAIFFMMHFIVPMFADIFKRFGGDLPALTQFIMTMSDFVSDTFVLGFVVITGVSIFLYTQKEQLWYRRFFSTLVLKLPYMGEIVRKIYLARFCNSLDLLVSSKVPLLKAIGLIKQMIKFYPLEVSLTEMEHAIMQGEALHVTMSRFTIFPKRMVSLIKVGEEVNQLEQFFNKIAKQYTEEVEHQSAMIGSLIEPVMIIFLGLIVGVILVAMYLPLFQLSSSFGI